MSGPLLSIVIPTKNSAANLNNCLETIGQQTYGNYEVIIVDGFSTDGTREIAEKFGAKYLTSPEKPPGARNLGFSQAGGQVFVSIDSDMLLLEKGLFGEIASMISNYDALIIPEVGYGTDFMSRCKDLEKRCYLNDSVVESARAFRKDAFNAVGGYDPKLHFGEDWDIHYRIKNRFKIGRANSRIMHDTRLTTLGQDLRKAYTYGYTLRSYAEKGNDQLRQWTSPHHIFFIKHFRKLVGQPLEGMGIVIIKLAEYSFGLAGFLASYLLQNKKPSQVSKDA